MVAESVVEESLLDLLVVYDAFVAAVAVLLLLFALCALVSIGRSDVEAVPALVWVIVVLLLPIVGATAWFLYRDERARMQRRAV